MEVKLKNGELFKEKKVKQELPKDNNFPRTIEKYVASLIAFFSNIKLEDIDENGNAKKLPVVFANREHLVSISEHDFYNLFVGQTSYIPRASLSIDSMTASTDRQMNRMYNLNVDILNENLKESPYAEIISMPTMWNFDISLNVILRGMSNATMIIEQVCSTINPEATIEIIERENTENIKIKLESVNIENANEDSYSNNLIVIAFKFKLFGHLYRLMGREPLISKIYLDTKVIKTV